MRKTKTRVAKAAMRRGSRPRIEALEGRQVLSGITDLSLDFGTKTSPVAPGYVSAPAQNYTAKRGYGWRDASAILGLDTGGSNPLSRDFNLGLMGTYLVDVPQGTYDVVATLGDPWMSHSNMSMQIEGQLIASALTTGAGQTATVASRVNITDGQATIRLAADWWSNFSIRSLTIHRVGSQADAGPAQSGQEGSPIAFQGAASGPGIRSYLWDFGDGTTAANTLNPQHIYRDNGTYQVTLSVTDGVTTSTDTTTATVANVAPTASAGGPYQAIAGQAITLAGTVTDPGQADVDSGFTYTWDFGDSSPVQRGLGLSAPNHTYQATGTYTLTVTATDKDNGQSLATGMVTVTGAPGSVAGNPLNKPVLDQSDFSFVGSFRMPTSANGWSTAYSMGGLTHRYVDGQLRFLTTSHVYSGGLVYETNFPGVGGSGASPQARVVQNWGDVYTGEKWVGNDGGSSGLNGGVQTYGLYYDQQADRLYWNYGHWYNAANPYNPSFGYSILNDETDTAQGMGAWSLEDRPEKFDRGGTLAIPQWFADQYTGGRTLGVGFGGYFSIVSSASFGPALAAVSPPDPATDPDRSALDNVPLIGYPYGAPARAERDPNYTSYYEGGSYPTTPGQWNPADGTGYWTWSDSIYGAASWIDTPELGGVLYIAKVGQGDVYYQTSDRHAQGAAFEWMVYDPKDLADVASGTKQQWEIQPKHRWTDASLPVGALDQAGYSGDGFSQVGGITFDATTNRLFVLVNGAWKDGVEWYPEVYVYQLSGEDDGTPPIGPTVTANFMGIDSHTQGSWLGQYGTDGYALANDAISLPASVTATPAGHSTWTWESLTSDPRALQRPSDPGGRIAATWYSGTSFTIDVDLAGDQLHELSAYVLDWDNNGRQQRIDVFNANNGTLLDSQTIGSFTGGKYLKWSVSGRVKFRFTALAGPNAVLSGLFFD